MSVIAEAIVNLVAEMMSQVPVRTMRRVGAGVVKIAALAFYGVGRGLLKLTRAPRSETGVPEAILGFLIVAGLIAALVRLPLRLLPGALMR
ncbi:MAG: hypothetical protein AB7U75_04965 [Hyphomicrobiaceae bacterium]